MKIGQVSITTAVLLSLGGVQASAQNKDYEGTVQGCRDYLDNIKGDMPTTFDKGFMKGLCTGMLGSMKSGSYLCPASPITVEQAARAVVEYADKRTAKDTDSFPVIAAEALRAAWPCKR